MIQDTPTSLTGIDIDMARAITGLIGAKYGKVVAPVFVEAPAVVPPSKDSTLDNFNRLYSGLEANLYDVAMAGQMVLGASNIPATSDPVWTSATALIYPAITYTGKAQTSTTKYDFTKVMDFDSFVAAVQGILKSASDLEFTFFSVINPGPSPGSAQNLVALINDGLASRLKSRASWTNGLVSDAQTVLSDKTCYFSVGDAIASGYLCTKNLKSPGIYFNIPAVKTPSIDYDAAIRSATIMPVAAFTLKGR